MFFLNSVGQLEVPLRLSTRAETQAQAQVSQIQFSERTREPAVPYHESPAATGGKRVRQLSNVTRHHQMRHMSQFQILVL